MICFLQDANGISSSSIVAEARRHIGSTEWSYSSCRNYPFCDTNKCNTFVAFVLNKVGAKVPNRSVFVSIIMKSSIQNV